MQYKVEVVDKPGIFDAVGQGVSRDIADLGISSVKEVRFIQVYTLEGNLAEGQVVSICQELLTDKVTQVYKIITEHPALLHLGIKDCQVRPYLADRPVRASAQ